MHAERSQRCVGLEEAERVGLGWRMDLHRQVRGDMKNYRWKGLSGGTPKDFSPQGSHVGVLVAISTWKCPMHSKTGCRWRLRQRISSAGPGDRARMLVELHTNGCEHCHDPNSFIGAGVHPVARDMLNKMFMLNVTEPQKVLQGLASWNLRADYMPSVGQVRSFDPRVRDVLVRAGIASCVAGLVRLILLKNYYALRENLGMRWTAHVAYVVPGVDTEALTKSNVVLVVTTDALCRRFASSLKDLYGGWLGCDGQHKTNYSGLPLVPLVGKDANDRYFHAGLALLGNERGNNVVRAIRLFLCWVLHRLPDECAGLERIHLPDGDGAMLRSEGDVVYSGADVYPVPFDPALQEVALGNVAGVEADDVALDHNRLQWEMRIGEGMNWEAMRHGYTDGRARAASEAAAARRRRAVAVAAGGVEEGGGAEDGDDDLLAPEANPPALRVRYGGADNADHYASALAFGAHAVTCNCATHLIVRNACLASANLYKALGGWRDKSRADAVATIALLRDVPSVSHEDCLDVELAAPATDIFDMGVDLFLEELRANGKARAALLLYDGYLKCPRKRRWGAAHFPPLIPNHNNGTEGMNSLTRRQLAGFTLHSLLPFADRMLNFVSAQSSLLATDPAHAYSSTMTKVLSMYPMWRHVHHMTMDRKPCPHGERARYVAFVQMHEFRTRFLRHTSARYIIPSTAFLSWVFDTADGMHPQNRHQRDQRQWEAAALQMVNQAKALYSQMVRDPRRYGETVSLDHYLRLAVRTFYVLERLPPTAVRSPFSRWRCTCPAHRKDSVCKHSVCQTIMEDRVEIPPSLNLELIGNRYCRGPGRKPRVTATTPLRTFGDEVDLRPRGDLHHPGGVAPAGGYVSDGGDGDVSDGDGGSDASDGGEW